MTLQIYINGTWTNSTSPEVLPVINPTTETEAASVPAGSVEDVNRAVAAARDAFDDWSHTQVGERAEALRAISDAMLDSVEDLALAAATDVGSPLTMGRIMHARVPAGTFANVADTIEGFQFTERNGNLAIVKEPVGVVGAITPWNYPVHQMAAKIAPALGAGCTIVIKPSEVAPLAAWKLAEIIANVGLPAGVFNLVSGLGSIVGEAIASHEDVDMVSFTGSVRAGTRVSELAALGVKRVTLELGGKSPNLVLDDVDDLASIVAGAVKAATSNSGQTCSALTRLLVPRERLKEAEELAADAANSMTLGEPTSDESDLGPLVSETQYNRVINYIATGIDEGARLVAGGPDRPVDGGGYFVRPTVFSDVTPDMTIAREEIFGPVLAIMPYEDEADGVRLANASDYGLSGAVWSADEDRAIRIARELRTGQVKINGGAFNPTAPFGGYKKSGLGRELGPLGLEEYFETKALTF